MSFIFNLKKSKDAFWTICQWLEKKISFDSQSIFFYFHKRNYIFFFSYGKYTKCYFSKDFYYEFIVTLRKYFIIIYLIHFFFQQSLYIKGKTNIKFYQTIIVIIIVHLQFYKTFLNLFVLIIKIIWTGLIYYSILKYFLLFF